MSLLRFLALLLIAVLLIPIGLSANSDNGPFYYLSPVPEATWVSNQTHLIFRPTWGLRGSGWRDRVVVVGDESGVHSGRWSMPSDQRTFIFEPDTDFRAGERVSVTVNGGRKDEFRYGFVVAPARPASGDRARERRLCACIAPPAEHTGKKHWPDKPVRTHGITTQGYELPDNFPEITASVSGNTAPGYVFLSNFSFRDFTADVPTRFLLIVDNTGAPVFFRPLTTMGMDFKVQPDGRISYFNYATDSYHLMDETYTVVDEVRAIGLQGTDLHELQVLPNGNYLLMGYQYITYDMSQLVEGGYAEAEIEVNVIQEIDSDNNVLFQWRTWDHFSILDANEVDLTTEEIDPAHVNAVELDDDGHIIISSRHMDEVTKINRDTGEIIWRMGGKNNDFTLVGDTQWFSRQHSARRQDSGTMTVFDNGNLNDPVESRVVEYEIDEENMTATLVWEYRNDPSTFGRAMGSVQRLPNGNTMVGWGATNPNATEARPDGSKVFELSLPDNIYSYRSFRFEWDGVAARPDLWATTRDNTLALNFTKFGDDGVAGYNVYRGDSAESLELIGFTADNRFIVHGFDSGETLNFGVTALDVAGVESPRSNLIDVSTDFNDHPLATEFRFTPRTLNKKSNGNWIGAHVDFIDGYQPGSEADVENVWLIDVLAPAEISIKNQGLDLKFDRDAVIALLDVGDAVMVTISGRIGDNTFEAHDVIRVIGPGASDVLEERRQSGVTATALLTNLPNPFNPSTVIRYRVGDLGERVTIQVFDVAGHLVRTLRDDVAQAQDGVVSWDGRDVRGRRLSSGVYFCRLTAGDFVQTRKMILMK